MKTTIQKKILAKTILVQEFQIRQVSVLQMEYINTLVNAKRTTLGMAHNARQIQNQQLAQDFPKMRFGTSLQTLHRHGMDMIGFHHQPEVTMKHQAQVNADLYAEKTFSGTVQSALIPATTILAVSLKTLLIYALQ